MNLPKSEFNPLPSVSVFEPVTENSVRSRLSPEEMKNMPTNGHNLETLRDMSPISHLDKIDAVGVATNMLSEGAVKYSKSGLRSALMKSMQTPKKPNLHG